MAALAIERYLESIREDGLALVAAADGHLSDPVPSCPGWRIRDLVWHVGEVHGFWTQIAGRQLLDPDDAERFDRPGDDDLLGWFGGRLADLLATLGSADPSEPVWSWASPDPVPTSWIHRRMGQETTVHRWDAQDAVAATEPIAQDLAVDGIDEFLTQFIGFDPDQLAVGAETVELVSTDTGDGWTVRVAGGELAIRPPDRASSFGPVEAEARASASDLLLMLWRRVRLDAIDVRGNAAALARFLHRAELD